MPRYRDNRIDVDTLRSAETQPVMQEITARPVAVADPGQVDDGFEGALLRGLSKMNPALSAWADAENSMQRAEAQERMRREEAAETERGLAAAAAGEAIPPEATRSYHDGYMHGSGRRTAMQDAEAVRAEWAKAKVEGDFDQDKFFTEKLAASIKDIQDPFYIKGYLAHYSQVEAQLREEKRAEDKQAQRQLAQENLGVASTRLAELPGSPEDHVADRLTFFAEQRQLGMAPDAIWDSYVAAVINYAEKTGDVGVLDRATIKGPDGVHPGLKPERGAKLIDARQRILDRQRVEANRTIDMAAAEVKATIDTALEIDPLSLGDATDIVMANYGTGPGKFIRTTAQAAEYIAKIQIEQAKAKDADATNAQLDGKLGPVYAHTKAGQKALEGRTNAVWDKVNPDNPQSVADAVRYSLNLYQTHSYADKHLKGLFAADVLSKRPDGSLPPAFKLAADAYVTMQDKGAHGLIEASMDQNTRAVLANYTRNVTQRQMSPEQAFDAAHKSLSADARGRTEVLKSAAFQKQMNEDLVDAQSRGIFSPFTSTSKFPQSIRPQYEDEVRFNLEAGMDPEAARDVAMKSLKERMVFTGAEYIVLPRSAEVVQHKTHIEAGLKGWLAEVTTVPGNEGSSFVISASPDGSKFTMFRDNAPTDSVSLDALVDAAKRQQYGSVEDKVGAVALNKRLVAGAVTPEEAYAMQGQLTDMRAKGFINGARFEQLMGLARKHLVATSHIGAQRVAEMHANLGLDKLGPLTNDDIQAVATPVLNPDGANPTAKNIALSALKENKAPAVALTLATEGLSLKVMRDPNKKHDTIGAGYNLSTREKKQILSDLQRAGVAPGDVESVLERGMEITPAQAIKLTQIVLDRESRPAAKAAFNARFGEGAFGNLPPNYQAALVYLAYNVGPGGIAKFPKAMEAIQQGNLAAAMAETKTYNNGQLLSRAHTLMKGMLKGESHFEELLNRGI